jgi:hypothetical protein
MVACEDYMFNISLYLAIVWAAQIAAPFHLTIITSFLDITSMGLLNIAILNLERVLPGLTPDYAVLSHRWTDDEVTF